MKRIVSQRVFGVQGLDPRFRAGCVGHWLGGGSGLRWTDYSGYGNDGVFTGAPKWTLGFNQIRDAVQLNAGSDLINCGSASVLDNLAAITLAAWVFTTSTAAEQQIVVKLDAGFTLGWTWNITSGALLNLFRLGSPSSPGWSSVETLATGVWMHLAITQADVAGNSLPIMYRNGTPLTVTTSAGSAPVSDAAANLTLGTREGDSAGLKGILDDVRIFNRVLNGAEIATLANPGFLAVVN